MNYFWIALIIAGLIALVALIEFFNTRCPACGKFRARQIIRSQTNYTSYDKDYKRTRSTRFCKCRFCGHEWTQRHTSSRRR